MTQIAAHQIKRAVSAGHSDDGQYVILKFANPDDSELILAIPPEEMRRAIDVAADNMEKCRKLLVSPKNPYAFHSDQFEVGRNVDNGEVALTFTFGSGGKLAFHFASVMALQLAQALQVAANIDPSSSQPPQH
jgi:hypothetical protein